MRDVLSSTFRVLINVGKVYQHVAKEQTEPCQITDSFNGWVDKGGFKCRCGSWPEFKNVGIFFSSGCVG